MAVVVAVWLRTLSEVRRERRGSDLRPVGFVVLTVGALAVPGLVYFYGITPAFLGLIMVGAAVVAWRTVGTREAADKRAVDDRVNMVTSYHLAGEWNRVREALRAPRSHAERSLGAPCLDEPFSVRTVDLVTGEEVLRDLDVDVPRNGWVVVDDSGSTLCTASPGALEAWIAARPQAAAG